MSQKSALVNLFVLAWGYALGLAIGFVWIIGSAIAAPASNESLALILGLYGVGFTFFTAAKLSVIRRERFASFGSKLMSPECRRLYRQGYCLMIVAVLLTVWVLAVEKALN